MTPTPAPNIPPSLAAAMPAWLIRLVALLVAASGAALSLWNPWHLTSDTAKAIVTLGALVVGGAIVTVHIALAAIHEYGFSTRALDKVEADELTELKAIWPDFRATYGAAKPGLDQLPGVTEGLAAVTADVAAVKGKVDAIPADQLQAILTALRAFGAGNGTPAASAPAAPGQSPGGATTATPLPVTAPATIV